MNTTIFSFLYDRELIDLTRNLLTKNPKEQNRNIIITQILVLSLFVLQQSNEVPALLLSHFWQVLVHDAREDRKSDGTNAWVWNASSDHIRGLTNKEFVFMDGFLRQRSMLSLLDYY